MPAFGSRTSLGLATTVPLHRDESRRRKERPTMDFWSFFWLLVWSFFFVAYLMVLFHIFGDLFRDGELGGFAKVVWVIALFVVPFLAALVYLIVRGKGMAEREMQS